MESNGFPNKIQVSQKTADLLRIAGKGHWLQAREDLVDAKGKGKLQTYWVEPPGRSSSVGTSGTASESTCSDADVLHVLGVNPIAGEPRSARLERLIDWNVDSLSSILKKVVARRLTIDKTKHDSSFNARNTSSYRNHKNPRSEICEEIVLPDLMFCVKATDGKVVEGANLSDDILWQLRDLISVIAYMYRSNPFHNFEHASHVAMSVANSLQRVVSPDVCLRKECKDETELAEALALNLHESTYGITSDPLTQFAIVFAALIHDVDHPGVSNSQLVAEKDPLAQLYDNQSVTEQNSITVAWELLRREEYMDLRACLFSSDDDICRFRQLVVNSVMATDIFDNELKASREARWDKAFQGGEANHDSNPCQRLFHFKATVVIEYLIQASDVAHTMQHWTIYQKWNRRLFDEVYDAYRAGRSPTNPANGWYQGELWFFDHYVIPLAKKLKECRVFGVSSDEFLDSAMGNRSEWQAKGECIVQELLEDANLRYGKIDKPEAIICRLQPQGCDIGSKLDKEWPSQLSSKAHAPGTESHLPASDENRTRDVAAQSSNNQKRFGEITGDLERGGLECDLDAMDATTGKSPFTRFL